MRSVISGVVAALALGAAAPGHAAEHIECIAQRLTPEALQAIFEEFDRNSAPPAVLSDAVAGCVVVYGWPPAAANDAYRYGNALAFAHGLRSHPSLTAAVRASVMRISERIDDATGRGWVANGVHGDDMARLAALFTAEGLNPHDQQQAPAAATLLFAVQLRKFSLIDFAAH